VGEDDPREFRRWRASLGRTTADNRTWLPSRQRYLNCKSSLQYAAAYVAYFLQKCPSEELLDAELAWVKGFRLLYLRGIDNAPALLAVESALKARIVTDCTNHLRRTQDPRRGLFLSLVRKYRFDLK
jgi:hypothetical protein